MLNKVGWVPQESSKTWSAPWPVQWVLPPGDWERGPMSQGPAGSRQARLGREDAWSSARTKE